MAATDGDDEITEFLLAVQLRLSRLALVLTGDHATAEDLVQDTMVKIVRGWSTVRRAQDPVSYVCRVMLNQWRDTGRRRKSRVVEVTLDGRDEGELGSTSFDHSVLDRLSMQDALRQLTAKQRAVLFLRYFEGLSVNQVAGLVGCSEGTVKSQTSYALRVLSKSGALAPANRRQ